MFLMATATLGIAGSTPFLYNNITNFDVIIAVNYAKNVKATKISLSNHIYRNCFSLSCEIKGFCAGKLYYDITPGLRHMG